MQVIYGKKRNDNNLWKGWKSFLLGNDGIAHFTIRYFLYRRKL